MTLVPSTSGLLHAHRILTLSPRSEGQAIWWHRGLVRAVGSSPELDRQAPASTPRYHLPDALVTPGFVDGHAHFAAWAMGLGRVRLAGVRSVSEVIARVAKASPVRGWVVGQGWDANGWPSPPSRDLLDAVQPGPVYLDSLDLHAAWVNTAALERAGVTRDTPDPFGGRIVRDASGEPTGLLLERAVEILTPHLPQPVPDELDQALLSAQSRAHAFGLTGIHDMEGENVLAAFRRLEVSGGLRLRVLFHPPIATLPSLLQQGTHSGQGSQWVRIGGVKMFLDGSLGSRTAWMLEPYRGSRDRGMPITTEVEARNALHSAAAGGLAATVHAIGDAAVRRALDLMSGLPRLAVPHRIEHFQCVHPDDLDRAAAAGIAVSMQPAHLLTDIPLVDRHWGARGRGAYAFGTLLRRGTSLVFGSDVPVASPDPREGVYAALERRLDHGEATGWRPEEKIGLEDAVRAYTQAAALAGGVGDRRGTLAPGQDADMVAWRVGPEVERGDGAAFRNGEAVLTVVGGAVVMQR